MRKAPFPLLSVTVLTSCLLTSCQRSVDRPTGEEAATTTMALTDHVHIEAHLGATRVQPAAEDTALRIGEAGVATVRIQLAAGLSASDSGVPDFIVQIDPPKGVTLTGDRVLSFEAQRDNEFLMEPWERLATDGKLDIPFEVTGPLPKGATLDMNVVGYVRSKISGDEAFVRRRLELALVPESEAEGRATTHSDWGPFDDDRESAVEEPRPLGIGDLAPTFTLPLAGASPQIGANGTFSLDSILGKRPFVLATYRGHW